MPLQRPADLTALTPDELSTWLAEIKAEAARIQAAHANGEKVDLSYVAQLQTWAGEVTADNERRAAENNDAAAEAEALAALANLTAEPAPQGDEGAQSAPAPEGAPVPEPAAADADAVVNAAERILAAFVNKLPATTPPPPPEGGDGGGSAPSVADLVGAGAGSGAPPEQAATVYPTMNAAPDLGNGYASGQLLADRAQLAGAVKARIKSYGQMPSRADNAAILPKPLPVPAHQLAALEVAQAAGGFAGTGRTQVIKNPTRHGVATIYRDETDEQFGTDRDANTQVIQNAATEWVQRAREGRMAAMRGTDRLALIAAWCAPSEPLYELCNQSSTDGMLPLPERTLNRGGAIIPANGGYEFGAIYDAIGNNTATNQQLVDGVTKTCIEIPCLTTEDEREHADWLCITASILQRRAWPESIEAFIAMALAAKLQKTNSRIIADIVSKSTDAGTAVSCTDDDAFSSLLSAIELAITDISYRAYMSLTGEFEVVLPVWALPQLRAAIFRRRAIEDPVKQDAWMQQQFARIGATVHFVYGWQDQHVSPLITTYPGGLTPITSLPTEVDFLVYPAGTWVAGRTPVIDLDTIYDSAGLASNSYTALFVEDGWATLQSCPYSRVYTASLNPCGCGCDGTGGTSPTSP